MPCHGVRLLWSLQILQGRPADHSQVSPGCSSGRWFSSSSSASACWSARERSSREPASQSVSSIILHFEIKLEQGPEETEALLHFLLDDHLDPDHQHSLLRQLHGSPRGLLQEEEEGHGAGVVWRPEHPDVDLSPLHHPLGHRLSGETNSLNVEDVLLLGLSLRGEVEEGRGTVEIHALESL